jgi:hypothetical protein
MGIQSLLDGMPPAFSLFLTDFLRPSGWHIKSLGRNSSSGLLLLCSYVSRISDGGLVLFSFEGCFVFVAVEELGVDFLLRCSQVIIEPQLELPRMRIVEK